MNVLIVGRTKMGSTRRCIGGLCADGRSIRLLDRNGHHWSVSARFQIGQVWDLVFDSAGQIRMPHIEDVNVTSSTCLGAEKDVKAAILARLQPWKGSSDILFDGCVDYTSNCNGYIEDRVPDRSTWYWIPDQDLSLRDDGAHYDYPADFFGTTISRGLKYVGEPAALGIIPAGTLVRVSLARWWRPDGDQSRPERCYLQLSGWF